MKTDPVDTVNVKRVALRRICNQLLVTWEGLFKRKIVRMWSVCDYNLDFLVYEKVNRQKSDATLSDA